MSTISYICWNSKSMPKQTLFSWLNKQTDLKLPFCLHLVDPATVLASVFLLFSRFKRFCLSTVPKITNPGLVQINTVPSQYAVIPTVRANKPPRQCIPDVKLASSCVCSWSSQRNKTRGRVVMSLNLWDQTVVLVCISIWEMRGETH